MTWTHNDHIAAIRRALTGEADPECAPTMADALAYCLPILIAAAPAQDPADDETLLADAQRRLQKRRRDAGLDPVTGRPLQAPIVGVARTDTATVPSATDGLLALVEAAAAGKVRLDPGSERW